MVSYAAAISATEDGVSRLGDMLVGLGSLDVLCWVSFTSPLGPMLDFIFERRILKGTSLLEP